MDEFRRLTDRCTSTTYNANNMGYSTLTDVYAKVKILKSKKYSMEPLADLQKSLFENESRRRNRLA